MSKVLIIGDCHFPYHSKKAYKKLMLVIEKEKPDVVIQSGDVLDQFVFSKFSRSLSITPEKEIKEGLKLAAQLWADVQRIVPKAKCYQLLGNHDLRMAKRIGEKLPELETFISANDFYKFKNVTVAKSDREFFQIDGVVYVHGWLSDSIAHARFFNKPVVHGHRHRPTIVYDNSKLWSMDVGHMADASAKPLGYTASKFSKWTMSCGIVEDGKNPRIICLE